MQCPKCAHQNPDSSTECQKCGVIFAKIKTRPPRPPAAPATAPGKQSKLALYFVAGCAVLAVGLWLWVFSLSSQPEASPSVLGDARQSELNDNLAMRGGIAFNYHDVAWHAVNTYGYDCPVIVAKSERRPDGFYLITCQNGEKLRVYHRIGKHPKITGRFGD